METPKKKSKFKIGCLGIIIIFVIIIIIALASGSGSSSTTGSQNTQNNSTNTSTSTSTNKSYNLGQTATIGNYNVTLSNLQNTQNITSGGVSMDSTKNNFVVLNLTVENNSNNPIASLDSGSGIFQLKADNKTYPLDVNGSIDASSNNNNSFSNLMDAGGQLSPSTPYSTPIVFDTKSPINKGDVVVNINGNTATFKL